MPEYPESVDLARAVIDLVSEAYPHVPARRLGAYDAYHGSVVSFVPGDRSAPADVWINCDQSFTLNSGRFTLTEDAPTTGELSERAEQIADDVFQLARRGIERNWLDRLIGGRREAVEPWPT